MKTDISTFCGLCAATLEPLPAALQATADELSRAAEDSPLHRPLATLNDIRARFRSLVEKLQSQQAYLLIFGPLKSGKSTLVNALSGAYVSEVTSLPGYPCLVYVQNSDKPRFALTRYNGRESVFANTEVLKGVIEDSHVALAEQIRAAEKERIVFDPLTHFPEAIRRVDVKVPAPNLAQSSTVLVDTPGLYSRMNFGYDVLTREFRNSAACAVFVVKTDNLFLEQVFVEFDQLLELFSRIFLVINVDSSKRDLQADGTLGPSAESAHPERVVEAFTTLSMAGSMRQAYDQNRVRIHALDLLNAASSVVSKGAESSPATQEARARFNAFVEDLTDYLDSSEFTLAFMRDSLRQGRQLCDEVRMVADAGDMRHLRDRQDGLALDLRVIDEKLAAADRLAACDWDAAFQRLRRDTDKSCRDRSAAAVEEAARDMLVGLARWYEGNECLKALEEQHWDPVLVHTALSLAGESRAKLVQAVSAPFGGLEPTTAVVEDLNRIGVSLAAVSAAVRATPDKGEKVDPYLISIDLDAVPVKRSASDWLAFRGLSAVRRRLFGEDQKREIEVGVKQSRLPIKTRDALARMMEESVNQKLGPLPLKYAREITERYISIFRADLAEAIREKQEKLCETRAALQQEFNANATIVNLMHSLNQAARKANGDLERLAREENLGPLPLPGAAQLSTQPAVEESARVASAA